MSLRKWIGRLAAVGLLASLSVPLAAHATPATGTPTVVFPLDPSQGQLPESITVDRQGNVYLSMATSIWKSDGQHAPTLFATLPIPAPSSPAVFALGLKVGDDGNLYAASAAFSPVFDASHVWRITPAGQISEYAHLDPNGFPNDLAFDDAGNLYVTDPWLGLVWKIPAGGGAPQVWLSDPLLAGDPAAPIFGFHVFGADGIAFDSNQGNLYVGNLDRGTILRIPVDRQGAPGAIEVFASDNRLKGADGIGFDVHKNLYVAVNAQNQLATVSPNGQVDIVAAGGVFDGPSSVAFGTRSDSRTLYISNFAIGSALTGGIPHPALLQMSAPYPGLHLP